MIKQLKKRFIIVTAVSISLVLLVLLGAINTINYQNTMTKIDNDLTFIENNAKSVTVEKDTLTKIGSQLELDIGVPDDPNRNFARAFTATVDSSGEVTAVDTTYYSILSEEDAISLAQEAIDAETSRGFIGDYKYSYNASDHQVTLLDCSVELNTIENLLIISIFAFIGGVILVVVLVSLMMGTAIKPIVESYDKQKQFITDVSHELKTPLTIIETNTELTEMENGESKWTKNSHKQVKRLQKLTNDLVTLTRMDEEQEKLMMTQVNISEVANDVIMGYEPLCVAVNKTLKTDIVEASRIKGNRDSIEKLISILLDNAIKYANDQGTIEMTLKKTGKKNILTVSNTVDEIEPGNHNEYFERFYRSDKSRNSERGGHGIGLSIAKAIVYQHKGKIKAESKDGKSLKIEVIFYLV